MDSAEKNDARLQSSHRTASSRSTAATVHTHHHIAHNARREELSVLWILCLDHEDSLRHVLLHTLHPLQRTSEATMARIGVR